jgi:hypothetical protein
MTRSRIHFSIPRATFFIILPILLALGPLATEQAFASFATRGFLTVNTEGGPFVERTIAPSTQVEISDQDVSIGGAGNNATAAYSVSILDAAISASSSAQNALHAPGDYWGGGGAVQSTWFDDDLTFTIPAGSYPSGVYAIAHMRVSGSAGASTGATARYIYNFSFGTGSVLVNSDDIPNPNLDSKLTLTAELVVPGTTLPSATTRLAPFSALVESRSSTPGRGATNRLCGHLGSGRVHRGSAGRHLGVGLGCLRSGRLRGVGPQPRWLGHGSDCSRAGRIYRVDRKEQPARDGLHVEGQDHEQGSVSEDELPRNGAPSPLAVTSHSPCSSALEPETGLESPIPLDVLELQPVCPVSIGAIVSASEASSPSMIDQGAGKSSGASATPKSILSR